MNITSILSRAHAGLRAAVEGQPPLHLILRLTLLLLVLYGASSPAPQLTLRAVCGLMLVFTSLLTVWGLWFVLAGVLLTSTFSNWIVVDNHRFLISYWTLACGLAVASDNATDVLRTTSRRLVAVVFLCATIWKLAAGQYLDGSFLYWTFLTDDRLQRLAAAFAGVPLADVAASADSFRVLATLGSAGDALAVPAWHRLDVTAATLSWLALLTEGAVGVLHLTGTRRLYVPRHVSVIAFIIATYSLVPVAGFAFVLAILGVAQTEPSDGRLRLCYVGVMGWIHLTMLPWQQLL